MTPFLESPVFNEIEEFYLSVIRKIINTLMKSLDVTDRPITDEIDRPVELEYTWKLL